MVIRNIVIVPWANSLRCGKRYRQLLGGHVKGRAGVVMNRDEVKSIVLYIVDNYNTERMEVTDDKIMEELTEECCKVAARQDKGSAEQQTDNTGSPKLPDSLLDGWDSVWSVLNDYASGDCKKRFSGTDPNAVIGDIYHKLAIIYQRQQEYVRQLQASRPGAGA